MKLSLMSYTMLPNISSGEMSLWDVMVFAKEQGFEAVEFSGWDFDMAAPEDIRRRMDELGLSTSSINCHFELAAAKDETFEQAVEGAKAMVDTALTLGADNIMIVPGKPENILGIGDKPRAAARIAEGLKRVVDYAGTKGVLVSVEDFPNLLYPLGTIDELQYMLGNAPGLRLTLDNGNLYPGGDDILEAYERFKSVIVNAHCKDWEPSPTDEGVRCADGRYIRGGLHGQGLLEQRPLIERLIKDGYSRYLAFEYEGVMDHAEAVRQAMPYIKGIIACCGKGG